MSQAEPFQFCLEGPESSEQIVIFLQGWPDNWDLWKPLDMDKTLSTKRRLLIDFPNTRQSQPKIKWGQDFPVLAQRLRATMDTVGLERYKKKMLVGHDWGSIAAHMFDKMYPGSVDQIVAIDAAPDPPRDIVNTLFIFTYQMIMVFAFLIGGALGGNWITRGMSLIFDECRHVPLRQINSSRNYPYYYVWRNVVAYLWKKENGFFYQYRPSVPIVYVYGKDKPIGIKTHSQKWLNLLRNTPGCEVHALAGEHWVTNLHPQFFTDLINRRMK